MKALISLALAAVIALGADTAVSPAAAREPGGAWPDRFRVKVQSQGKVQKIQDRRDWRVQDRRQRRPPAAQPIWPAPGNREGQTQRGARDAVIPYAHARVAHAAMPGSQLVTFEDAGHFPHHTDPKRFTEVLYAFLATSAPAAYRAEEWRELLRNGRMDPIEPRMDSLVGAITEETLHSHLRSGT